MLVAHSLLPVRSHAANDAERPRVAETATSPDADGIAASLPPQPNAR